MTVLIIGNAYDQEAARVKAKLLTKGVHAEYFDTSRFPAEICISWEPSRQLGTLRLGDNCRLPFNEISAVYWRTMYGVGSPLKGPAELQQIAYNDSMSMLRTFLRGCQTRWINHWDAIEFHKEKPLQLTRAGAVGARLPRTLISNNADEIRAFVADGRTYIFKPVSGGATTMRLTAADLVEERLKMALKLAPVTIQEYIDGVNIRTFVIGDRVFTVEIVSSMVDFRDDQQVDVVARELPQRETELALAIARAFGLEWTAIDWRRDGRGDYYFLEANPSPMFVCSEDRSGLPISDTLVDYLS